MADITKEMDKMLKSAKDSKELIDELSKAHTQVTTIMKDQIKSAYAENAKLKEKLKSIERLAILYAKTEDLKASLKAETHSKVQAQLELIVALRRLKRRPHEPIKKW